MKKMKHLDILNTYKINLYLILNIMFRLKTNSIPKTLQNNVVEHNYSERYSKCKCKEPNIFLGLLNLQFVTSTTSLE